MLAYLVYAFIAYKRIKKLFPKKKDHDIEDSIVGLFFPRYDKLGMNIDNQCSDNTSDLCL
jgi:hypothetical protein